MGLLSVIRQRIAVREGRVYDASYTAAIEQGEPHEQATKLAEQAVQQRRRRRRIIFGAAG